METRSKKPIKRQTSRRLPWERANPKAKAARKKLDAAAKNKARARAKKAGRPYPNLVDNMWATRAVKS